MNIPLALTFARIGAIPLVVLFFYWPASWAMSVCAGLVAVASLTDWLDGYLARRWQQETALGRFLDPVADKLLVAAVLVLLASHDPRPIIVLPSMLIVLRELSMCALREWAATRGATDVVAVAWLGKAKTALQMLAVLFLLYFTNDPGGWGYRVGMIGLSLATIVAWWSLLEYGRRAWLKWVG